MHGLVVWLSQTKLNSNVANLCLELFRLVFLLFSSSRQSYIRSFLSLKRNYKSADNHCFVSTMSKRLNVFEFLPLRNCVFLRREEVFAFLIACQYVSLSLSLSSTWKNWSRKKKFEDDKTNNYCRLHSDWTIKCIVRRNSLCMRSETTRKCQNNFVRMIRIETVAVVEADNLFDENLKTHLPLNADARCVVNERN